MPAAFTPLIGLPLFRGDYIIEMIEVATLSVALKAGEPVKLSSGRITQLYASAATHSDGATSDKFGWSLNPVPTTVVQDTKIPVIVPTDETRWLINLALATGSSTTLQASTYAISMRGQLCDMRRVQNDDLTVLARDQYVALTDQTSGNAALRIADSDNMTVGDTWGRAWVKVVAANRLIAA